MLRQQTPKANHVKWPASVIFWYKLATSSGWKNSALQPFASCGRSGGTFVGLATLWASSQALHCAAINVTPPSALANKCQGIELPPTAPFDVEVLHPYSVWSNNTNMWNDIKTILMILYTHIIDLYRCIYSYLHTSDICSVSTHFNSVGAPQSAATTGPSM